MKVRKGDGPRLYAGKDFNDKYLTEFLSNNPVIVKDLGISSIDFEDCCIVCKPKSTPARIYKEAGFSMQNLSPMYVMKAAFYLVIHKCVYERRQFVYSRGSVALSPFPAYYNQVVKNSALKHFYGLDTTDPKASLGWLQVRPNFSKPALEKKGYYKNPVKIIVDTKMYEDIGFLINSKADLANLPILTVEEVAAELKTRFPMYSISLLKDYINEGFTAYTRLSLKGFPVNMTYYERGDQKEDYYKFQIRNFTNVYKALYFAFKSEAFQTALEHHTIKKKKDFKCRKQKHLNKIRDVDSLVRNSSVGTLKKWAALKSKDYIYSNYKSKDELLELYKCPIRNDYKYEKGHKDYWETKEERINIPI